MNCKTIFARIATVGATAFALCMPASAADIAARPYLPPPPLPMLYDWTGFYVGVHFGGSFSSETATVGLGSFDTSPSGVLGGLQVGYNYQFAPNMLVGVEGEMSWTSAETSVGAALPLAAATVRSSHNWYDTLAGRFGVLQSGWLFYGKLGLAWMNADYTVTAFPGFGSTLNTTRGGWMIGVGAEYRFTPSWSAKIEYSFLDFGVNNYGFAVGPASFDTQVHEIKVGVNYHFMPGTLMGRW